ncbi:hypothetical protein SCHPADRAFT_226629 [Schizopora paradoxa]|uniref:Zn(2)-C6 fungal-type domain-containing protein n=1 Tax=Schizopora paradoxa TaxID=27342 RepID=A0A0H2RWJ7_9AGAM|nr:hypothetical protein SCHPADRAFT_226629 [Schizopora paradoxa]
MRISTQRSTAKTSQKQRTRPEACIKCRESKLKCNMDKNIGSCTRCIQQGLICSGPTPTAQRIRKRQLKEKSEQRASSESCNSPASSSFTVPSSPDAQGSVCSDFSDMLTSQQRCSDYLNMNYVATSSDASGSGSSTMAVPYVDYTQQATQALSETNYDFVNTTLDTNLLPQAPMMTRRHSFPEDSIGSTLWASSDNFYAWEPIFPPNTCTPSDLQLAAVQNLNAQAVQSFTTSNDFLMSNYVQY